MEVDHVAAEKIRALTQELIDALLDLDDRRPLSEETAHVLAEHVGIAYFAGANQGGREVIAGLQRQFDEDGGGVTLALPPELLAENDII